MSSKTSIDVSYRKIGRITGPVLVGQIGYTMMGVVDALMVGRLGVTELAAVGLGNFIALWPSVFVLGMVTGVNTLVAQAVGAGRPRSVGVSFWQGIYLGLILAAALASCWALVPWVLGWVGTTPETLEITTRYTQIRMLGGLGLALMTAGDSFYRGIGRTTLLMWCGLAQLVLNSGLNYLLIFGHFGAPRLGAGGAAWGTVFAQLSVGGFLLCAMLGSKLRREFHLASTWRFEPRVFKTLVALSLPIGVQFFMEMGGIAVFCVVVARLGDAEMAATNAVIQTWSFAFMAAFALSAGATTLVGQCVGAERPEDARLAVRRVLNVGFLMSALLAMVYLTVPEKLMALFVNPADVERLLPFARPLFVIVVVCMVFDLIFNILSGALRGAGDTKYPMVVNIGSAWLMFVPVTIAVAPVFGLIGAWWCLVLHVVVMATALHLRFRGEAWVRPSLVPASGVSESVFEDVDGGAMELAG